MIRNLKTIQAYPEFQTLAGINTVRAAVQANAVPANLTPTQTARFTAKFLNGEWAVENTPAALQGVAHGNQRLKYRPNAAINLLVAYPDERTIFMERIWSDRRRGYGLGLQSFYWQVSLSHLNIQKRFTDEFLTGKGDYQIQKTPKTKVIKPIKSNAVNERWGMDLIDMSIQNTHRYIMSVVDNFSGYLFTRRLNNRNAATIRDALQNIVNTPLPNGSLYSEIDMLLLL
jgi:hypothetical protein